MAPRLPDRTRSLDVSAGYPARALAEAQRFCHAREADRRRSRQALSGGNGALEPRARGRGRVRLRGDPRHHASLAARGARPLRRRRARIPQPVWAGLSTVKFDGLRCALPILNILNRSTVGRVERSATRRLWDERPNGGFRCAPPALQCAEDQPCAFSDWNMSSACCGFMFWCTTACTAWIIAFGASDWKMLRPMSTP